MNEFDSFRSILEILLASNNYPLTLNEIVLSVYQLNNYIPKLLLNEMGEDNSDVEDIVFQTKNKTKEEIQQYQNDRHITSDVAKYSSESGEENDTA